MPTAIDSFGARTTMAVGDRQVELYGLDAVDAEAVARLPFSLKILLENLLRNEDGRSVTKADIAALAAWDPKAPPQKEIQFRPARVLMQDLTGVPCVVDLAAMRDAIVDLGGDPQRINPLQSDRSRHRPLRPGRRVRLRRRVPAQHDARSSSATSERYQLPPLGTEGVRQLQRRPARHRHRAPGEPRVPRLGRVRARRGRRRDVSTPTRSSARTRTRR